MEEIINSYLTFKVAGNTYGVHVDSVVEIMEYVQPKSNPSNLPYLLGLVEHRGNVIPLIDTGVKFGMKPIELNDQSCVIVLKINSAGESFDVALAVDHVSEVMEIDDDRKQPIEGKYKPDYVNCAVKGDDDTLALIINADRIFSDTDIISLTAN